MPGTSYDRRMLVVLNTVVGGLTFVAWLSAVIHAFMLVPHRKPEFSALQLWTSGWRFYISDTFEASGHAIHRRFLISAGVFLLSVFATVGVSVLASQ
jgi:hypothetical protein